MHCGAHCSVPMRRIQSLTPIHLLRTRVPGYFNTMADLFLPVYSNAPCNAPNSARSAFSLSQSAYGAP
eukprot:2823239-Rhodomonas_salina.1